MIQYQNAGKRHLVQFWSRLIFTIFRSDYFNLPLSRDVIPLVSQNDHLPSIETVVIASYRCECIEAEYGGLFWHVVARNYESAKCTPYFHSQLLSIGNIE